MIVAPVVWFGIKIALYSLKFEQQKGYERQCMVCILPAKEVCKLTFDYVNYRYQVNYFFLLPLDLL